MEGKELEVFFFSEPKARFWGFSARPGGLGESAGCCYASFWMLAMKSEKPEISANCVKEQGRKCRLVGKANFFQMSSPLRALVLLKLEDWCKMLTVKTCMSFFLSFQVAILLKRSKVHR